MTRVMSIWFPQLPLDLWVRRMDPRLSGHFAVTREIKNALRVTHANEQAYKAGITAGQSLPDAMAVCPTLITEKHDEERVQLLLRALWRWSDRLSPWAALDNPDGLFLNVTGCAHLFGGEAMMREHALSSLMGIKITSRIGIADTKQGAWAAARFSKQQNSIIAPGELSQSLSPLPVAALNISAATTTNLRRTGLKTIGDLYKHKTSELARRFGLELTQKLSCALGYTLDPISPQAADPVYAARMSLPDPIGLLDDINHVLTKLADSVSGRLEKDQIGARRYELTIRCPDRDHHTLIIGFARPCHEPGAILQQFAKPLEDIKLEFGADNFRLVAKHLEPARPRQRILVGESQALEEDFGQLISTLGNRLGFDRIRKFKPQDYHAPELAYTFVETTRHSVFDWQKSVSSQSWTRPFRLFQHAERLRTLEPGRPPKKFEWRKDVYSSSSVTGPERLAPPWWEGHDNRLRDYWNLQTHEGPRLWLMTYPGSQRPDWFVAGQFV